MNTSGLVVQPFLKKQKINSTPDISRVQENSGFLFIQSDINGRLGNTPMQYYHIRVMYEGSKVNLSLSGDLPYAGGPSQPFALLFTNVTSNEIKIKFAYCDDKSSGDEFEFAQVNPTNALYFRTTESNADEYTVFEYNSNVFLSTDIGYLKAINNRIGTTNDITDATPFFFEPYAFASEDELASYNTCMYNRWPSRTTLKLEALAYELNNEYIIEFSPTQTLYLHCYFIMEIESNVPRGYIKIDMPGSTQRFTNYLEYDGTNLKVVSDETQLSHDDLHKFALLWDSSTSKFYLQFEGPKGVASSYASGGGFLTVDSLLVAPFSFSSNYGTDTPTTFDVLSGFIGSTTEGVDLDLTNYNAFTTFINPPKLLSSVYQSEISGKSPIFITPNSNGGLTARKYTMSNQAAFRLNATLQGNGDLLHSMTRPTNQLFTALQFTTTIPVTSSVLGSVTITLADEPVIDTDPPDPELGYSTIPLFNTALDTAVQAAGFTTGTFSIAQVGATNFIELTIIPDATSGDITINFQDYDFTMSSVLGFYTNTSTTFSTTTTITSNEESEFFDTRYTITNGYMPVDFRIPRNESYDFMLPLDRGGTGFLRYARFACMLNEETSRMSLAATSLDGTKARCDLFAMRISTIEAN